MQFPKPRRNVTSHFVTADWERMCCPASYNMSDHICRLKSVMERLKKMMQWHRHNHNRGTLYDTDCYGRMRCHQIRLNSYLVSNISRMNNSKLIGRSSSGVRSGKDGRVPHENVGSTALTKCLATYATQALKPLTAPLASRMGP